MLSSRRFSVPIRNTAHRYGIIAQLVHWLVVALLAAQFPLGMTASSLPISPTRLALLAWHKSIGFLILGVIILRLGWRLYSPPPPLPATVPVLQQYAARVSHGLMYVILLAMPLVGWASSSAANLTVSVFGWFVLPNLTAPDKELAQWLISTHVVMAWLLLSIIVLHVTAALWHHFVIRDDVLKRMLPLFTRTHEDSSP